jgi:branched-chain amino acid transport system permease protein
MNSRIVAIILLAVLLALPLTGVGKYPLHLMVTGLLWAFIYTSWSIMGRLGLVSLGHGAFLGIGAYTVVLLWNLYGISPWIGLFVAVAITLVLAFVIGYPCFKFRIVGHYFALVTLALTEVVRLVIVGLREQTGGSLGITPKSAFVEGSTVSLGAMQFSDKVVWFYIMVACWLAALYVWHRVDLSMKRLAMQAIAEDEDAASSIGVNVGRTKLAITLLSAAMTCIGGVLYAQYQLYVNPETVSGIGISLQMVFGVIAGGMFVMFGPTFGAIFLLVLSEGLRILIGNEIHGVDTTIYGLLLILFIIYMPKGILGALQERLAARRN